MFGYVTADISSLSENCLRRYRGCYCGLCRTIGQSFGTIHRLTLNYDLTFLALFLTALYEPKETARDFRCALHPFKMETYWYSDATEYAADMNIALSYYKALDDSADDRSLSAQMLARLLKKEMWGLLQKYPRQLLAIQKNLSALADQEKSGSQDVDLCANLFGKIMEELFVWREDRWETALRTMGRALGRFIYLADAVLDLAHDLKHGRFNVLSGRCDPPNVKEQYFPVLSMLLGECTEAFETLPIIQDLDILRNILYSGVWIQYRQSDRKEASHV